MGCDLLLDVWMFGVREIEVFGFVGFMFWFVVFIGCYIDVQEFDGLCIVILYFGFVDVFLDQCGIVVDLVFFDGVVEFVVQLGVVDVVVDVVEMGMMFWQVGFEVFGLVIFEFEVVLIVGFVDVDGVEMLLCCLCGVMVVCWYVMIDYDFFVVFFDDVVKIVGGVELLIVFLLCDLEWVVVCVMVVCVWVNLVMDVFYVFGVWVIFVIVIYNVRL